MLVLSRQRDETIMIGDDIQITVVDIRGDKVRLGISAPTRIAVHRKEVYDSIKAENQKAASIGSGELAAFRSAMAQPAGGGGGPIRPGGKAARLAATSSPLASVPLPTIRPTGTASTPTGTV